jgi:acetyltransferase
VYFLLNPCNKNQLRESRRCSAQFRSNDFQGESKFGIENLNCFFNPKTIAVIGASERKTSLGGLIFNNLVSAYQGSVFPVNEFRQTIQGVKAWPSITKIPSKIELAIIATPAHTIPQIIDECGKAGVLCVIIVSAGLNECDGVGQKLAQQILERNRKYGIRILGPNSLGVIRPKNNLYATFGDKKAVPGKIAFISQSAALCGTILDWSQETKVGLSAVVSLGSTIDVDFSDLIEYLGADSQTRAIMLYVETIKNVRAFLSAARGYARTKPIVIVKAGRFNNKRDVALSQGTLIAEDDIYDAVFRRIGIVRVDTVNELFDCAKALSMQPNPGSSCLTIITNADGPGVLAADQLNLNGGRLSSISESACKALKNVLPYYCRISNPIDLLEEATPERFKDVLHSCLNDQNSENVLLIYSPQGVTKPSSIASITVDLARTTRKTLLVTLMGEDRECQEARKILHLNGVPTFKTAEEAVFAFMNMYTYTRNLELLYQTPDEIELNIDNPLQIKGDIRRAYSEGRAVLSLSESLSLLQKYKIPVVKTAVVKTSDEASVIASKIGYPIIMKALLDKSSSQNAGKRLSAEVNSEKELIEKFIQITENAESTTYLAEFQEVAIQPKLQSNQFKIFLGLRKHPRFGPIIVLGRILESFGMISGIAIGFPPLNQVLAKQLMEKAKFFQIESAVGIPLDFAVVEQIIVRFSQIAIDFFEIEEIDINPLIIYASDAVAVDASVTIDINRVMRENSEHDADLIIAPYPKQYVAHRVLKNDVHVIFRPIKPEDEFRFNELFKSLSQESVRFRFFQIIREMSHDTLSRYCNLDYDREIAIVSELDDGRLIGIVRLILDPDRKKGEFAIMVGDAWHGLGLGSKLMEHILMIANDLKVEAIYSLVSSANLKMINLCDKMGFENKITDEYTVEMWRSTAR